MRGGAMMGLLRIARRGTLLALGAGLALLPSCSSLFGLDDYSDSTDDLCDLAQKCYDFAACESHVGPKLDGASADARSEWLAAIPTKDCLANCAKSRKCLTMAPVCNAPHEPCDREEQCCDFLSGRARCQAPAGAASDPDAGPTAAKRCCRPDGVQTTDPSSCCSGVYNPKNKACGQNVCRPEHSDCTDDLQCCSQRCDQDKCSEEQCLPLATPCSPSDKCCDGAQCLATTGACGFPEECRTLRAPCDVAGVKPCCQGLTCLPAINKHPTSELWDGLCQPNEVCMPKGYDCTQAPCCQDTGEVLTCRNGECKPKCEKVGEVCADNGDCCSGKCELGPNGPVCACAQIYCEEQGDCCSGICVGGVCTAACAVSTVCHDECIPGPALVEDDIASCKQVDPSCLSQICAVDPFCCCVEWDATCVKQVIQHPSCGVAACN